MRIEVPPRIVPTEPTPLAADPQLGIIRDGRQPRIYTGEISLLGSCSRRSFPAPAAFRTNGSESFKHRSNSHSRDFSPNVPIAYAPQDFSQGSSLLTSAATAFSRLSILACTCRF